MNTYTKEGGSNVYYFMNYNRRNIKSTKHIQQLFFVIHEYVILKHTIWKKCIWDEWV